MLGRYEESLSAQRNAIGARGDPGVLEALSQGYEEGGYTQAQRRAGELRASRRNGWAAAQDFIRAGQTDQALFWLEQMYDIRNPNMPYISVAPIFDGVRSDPRFRALLQRMKLPM
jgi:hypothetical protein